MSDRPSPQHASRCRTAPAWATFLLCLLALGRAATASELRQSPIVKAVQKVGPSIVNIRGEKTLAIPGAQATQAADTSRRVNGMGTGVIVDPRGYILTNHHVVEGVREIQVTLPGETRFIARLVARDLDTDLAVIKIDAPDPLPVICVGTSSDLLPGESVIAVGNAYGYENTVTRGIISALHRAVQVSDAQFYNDLIQTDAPINPGNSGGPLLNIDGEMIGINVAVRAGAQNIGFAIPVDKALDVAAALIASCNAKKSCHGVVLASVTKNGKSDVVVASVTPNSPAAEAGLQAGDKIVSVDEQKLQRALDFHRAFIDRKSGDELKVTVQRRAANKLSSELDVSLVLGESIKEARPLSQPAWETLGLELTGISGDEFRRLYQTHYRGGLLIAAVRPDSPAAGQGIRRGDVLVGLHKWETISQENVAWVLSQPDLESINPLKFFIIRGNETLFGYLPVATKKIPVALRKETTTE